MQITSPEDNSSTDSRLLTISGNVTSTSEINTETGATITLNGEARPLPLTLEGNSTYNYYSFGTQVELIPGSNTITVTAIDINGQPGNDTITVNADIQSYAIKAELTWDTNGTDLDSHLIAPCYADNDMFGDCYYANPNPDWDGSGNSSGGDPSLDQDVITGYGPEYIVLVEPPFNGIYQYKVYYYDDNGYGSSIATVKIWVNDVLVFQGNRTLSNYEWWDCACVSWPSGTVTAGPCSTHTLTVTSSGCCPILVEGLPCGNMTVSAGNTDAFYAPENTQITLTAQTGDECSFDYWQVDGGNSTGENPITVTMDSDHAATATCTPLYTLALTNDGCHNVSVSSLPGGNQDVPWGGNATFVLPEGTEVTLTPSDSDGIVFTGWYIDAEGSPRFDRPLTIAMDASHQVTAVCVPAHTLYVSSNGCCPILVEGLPGGNQTVSAGDAFSFDAPENSNITLTARPGDSCQFGNWTVDEGNSTTDNPITVTMDSNHAATATCIPLYTLTVTSDGCCPILVSNLPEGNQTVPAGGNATFMGIPEGIVVALEAVDSGNCTFDHWIVYSTDGNYIYDKVIQVTMDQDHTAICYSYVPTYDLLVVPQYGHIIVSLPGGNETCSVNESYHFAVPAGTVVTLEAEPEDSYFFYYWLINGEIVYGNPGNLTMDGDYSVKDVRRNGQPSTLSVTSSGCCPIGVSGLPGIEGTMQVPAGGNGTFLCDPSGYVSLEAQTGDSCQFGNWTVDEGNSTTDNPITLTMDSDHTATLECSSAPTPTPLAITTDSLPDGEICVYYSQTLSASGGSGNYTWSISDGSLPGNVTLDPSTGAISGTPDTADISSFTVQVSDGIGNATKGLSITINAELIVNPGFENSLTGWSTSEGNATYSVDATTSYSGNCSVQGVELDTGSLGRLYQDVTGLASPGNQYQISGWIKTSDVTGSVVIGLDYVASGGWTPGDGYVQEIGYVTGTQDWTFFQSDVFSLPPMPSDAEALWFLFDFNGGNGTAWWDDVSLVCVSCASGPAPASSCIVGWWPADGNATDIADSNPGILMNGTTFAPGKVGQAFSFDGQDDYVLVPYKGNLPSGSQARTFETWVYTRPSSWAVDRHTIFQYGETGVGSFSLDMDEYPYMQFYTWSVGDLFYNAGVPEEGWVHIAITYDGDKTVCVYTQGELRGNITFTEPLNTVPTDLEIGTCTDLGAYFDGLIDEFTVYDCALSPSEIQAIYNAGSAGKDRSGTSTPALNTLTVSSDGCCPVMVSGLSGIYETVEVPAGGTATFLCDPSGTVILDAQGSDLCSFDYWMIDGEVADSGSIIEVPMDTDHTATVAWISHLIHVKGDAAGLNDGTSWADAFTDLQSALNSAVSGDQIWVAAGTYKPSVEIGGSGERYEAFQMVSGVGIYGGFAGTEANVGQRDWETNVTILSGDIGEEGNSSDNCYHVIYNPSGLDNTAVLDGFTITGGNANVSIDPSYYEYRGGGMYNLSSSPTVTNCTFSGNNAGDGGGMCNDNSSPTVDNCTFLGNSADGDGGGGGMFNGELSSPTVANCTFSDNSATYGGGMDNYNSSPAVTNCTFSGNSASDGGGMCNDNSCPTVTNCIFSSNSAYDGGGMYNLESSSPTVTNCSFSDNSAQYGGGMYNSNSSPTVTNCTFSGNTASVDGGGMYNYWSSPTVTNCILWGDTTNEVSNVDSSSPIVTYCDVQGGYEGTGNVNDDPLLTSQLHLGYGSPCIDTGDNSAVPSGITTDLDGNPRIMDGDGNGTATVDMGAFEYVTHDWYVIPGGSIQSAINAAFDAGGGTVHVAAGNYTELISLRNNVVVQGAGAADTIIDGNSTGPVVTASYGVDSTAILEDFTITNGSGVYGGGMSNQYSSPTVTNCTFSNGSSAYGGGMYNYNSSPTVTNCIFSNNVTSQDGGGMFNDYSSPTVTNCTFSSNSSGDDCGGAMCNFHWSSPTVTNCTFSSNLAFFGGGMCNDTSSPTVTNCTFSNNSANWANSAGSGGGMYNGSSSSPIVTNCTFSDNSSFCGGGMYNENSSTTVTNCIFSGNTASDYFGGGMYNNYSSPTVTNCTFSGNSASDAGGIYNRESSPKVTNCILWGDTPNEITNSYDSSPIVTYSDVQGGYDVENNINADPLFKSAADFHLQAGSPCIDTGNNLAPSLPAKDFEGNPRVMDGDGDLTAIVDMGAFEYVTHDWYVIPGGSIQAAINAAAAAGGGTVHVAAGNYTELISLRNNVAVQGAGAEVTTIEGNSTGTVVTASWVESTAILEDFTISGGNGASGGGMDNYHSSPTVTNCTFSDNSASDGGGGGMSSIYSSPTVTNCTFSGNSAFYGGGMDNDNSPSTVIDCTFSGNSASDGGLGGGGMFNGESSPRVTNCSFSDNSASEGGGMYNWLNSSPTAINCSFSGNSATAGGEGGGILCKSNSSPTITNCTINSNSARWSGGGIECDSSSSPTISNCIVSDNSSNYGGGMQCNQSSPLVVNCIIGNNTSSNGGAGINNDNASSTFINCTITGNNGLGGGLHSGHDTSSVTGVNCIIWGNTWGNTTREVSVNSGCSLTITYSDIRDGYDGEGNINADPLFASGSDFHLQTGSPCIDTGNDSAVPPGITTDLDGNPRIVDGDGNGTATVDMGAYECPMTYDLVNDFSSTTNPNGTWSYGWEPKLVGTFNLYDVCDTSVFEESPIWYSSSLYHPPEVWKNTGSGPYNYVQPGEVSLHPGSGGQFSVVRWKSPLAGNVSISGYFGAGDIGVMSYFICKNGNTSLFRVEDTYDDGPFTLNAYVSIGDTIDFMIGEGYGYGSTPLHATITLTP